MSAIKNFHEFGKTSNPKQIIFLLHGLGSNGQDLISLAPYWKKSVPNALFISPDAPFACDMVPAGYPNSFQWFSLQNRDKESVRKGVEIAKPILETFIAEQTARFDLSLKDAALVGFSQGTMMSLYTAPRLEKAMAGVVGYSGALFGEDALIQDPDEFVKMPINLIHGEADDVVTIDKYHHAKESLTAAGYTVTGHTTANLTHSIDEKGIESGSKFLAKIFA